MRAAPSQVHALEVGWFARMLIWAMRNCQHPAKTPWKAPGGSCGAEAESPGAPYQP